MSLWQTNRYINFFGYRFYYKKFFLYQIAKPLGLPAYQNWKLYHRRKDRQNRKKNGEKANPRWTRNTKAKLIERDGDLCSVCQKQKFLTIDHIIPLFKIGKKANELENLQLLCLPCHTEKSRQENLTKDKVCTN